LPGGRATGGSRPAPLPDIGPNDFALALGLKSRGSGICRPAPPSRS
jgi:hypothetical protein